MFANAHRRTLYATPRYVDPTLARHADDCPSGRMTVESLTGPCPRCGPNNYARVGSKHRKIGPAS